MQGTYPMAIASSRVPEKYHVFFGFMLATELQFGMWNFFVLIFST